MVTVQAIRAHMFVSILVVVLLANQVTKAQWPVTFAVQNFSQACDISSRTFTYLFKGKEGFIWIGTREGLIRYDGYDFKLFKNTNGHSNHIVYITQNQEGVLWCILSDQTICSFENASQYFSNHRLVAANPEWNEHLRLETLFFDAQNRLWIGTKGYGLLQLDITKHQIHQINLTYPTDAFFTSKDVQKEYNRVSAICSDASGNLWLASPDGLYVYQPGNQRLRHYHQRPASSQAWRNDYFRRILLVNGTCILGSWGGGLSIFDTLQKTFTVHKFDSLQPFSYTANIVHDLVLLNQQLVYVASADKGFLGFNLNTKQFTAFSHSEQYPYFPNWLWQRLIADHHGHYWALNDNGLLKITPGGTFFKYQSLPVTHTDNNIFYLPTDIFENEYYKITCTQFADGLHVYTKATGQKRLYHVQKKDEPYELVYRVIPITKHRFWIVSRDYVYLLDASTAQFKKLDVPIQVTGLHTNHYWCAQQDAQGQLWVGSLFNGILVFGQNGIYKQHFHTKHPQKANRLKENEISALTLDAKGCMWAASKKGMLWYFDNHEWHDANTKGLNLSGTLKVHDLYCDRLGHIWISSEQGLMEMHYVGTQLKWRRTFGNSSGLSYQLYTGLQQDAFDNIWAVSGNEHDVVCINRKTGLVQNFNNSNGLHQPGWLFKFVPSYQCPFPLLLAHAGIYRIEQEQHNKYELFTPAQLLITEININGKAANLSNWQQTLHLQPHEKNIQIGYAATNFGNNNHFEYEYSLEKQNTRWISNGNKRNLSLINLPAGNYHLQVRAKGLHQVYTNTLNIHLWVGAYFYQETWFWSLVIAFLVIAGFALMTYRNQKEKQILALLAQKNALEKEKAGMEYAILREHLNPHFLFNAFTSLSSLIRTNNEKAIHFLAQLSGIYRYILQNKNKDLVPLATEIGFVKKYIDLQKTRFEGTLFVNMQLPNEVLNKKVVPASLQGLIENALKHNVASKQQPLLIDVFIEEQYLVTKNNLQPKAFVVGSNQQGLMNLQQLYTHYTDWPVIISATPPSFIVKIPLL